MFIMKSNIAKILVVMQMFGLPLVAENEGKLTVRQGWREMIEKGSPSKTNLERMLETDMKAFFVEADAVRRLRSVEGSYSLYEAAISAIALKAEQDPLPILKALSQSDFEEQHIQKIAHAASESLVQNSPEQLFGYLSNVPGGEGVDLKVDDMVLQEMLVSAFRNRPKQALEWIKATRGRASLLEAEDHDVLRAVIDVSPEPIIELARTHEEVQLNGLNRAFSVLAGRDLAAATQALKLWKTRGEYPYCEAVIAVVRAAVAKSGLEKAKTWSKSLGDDGLRAWFYLRSLEDAGMAARELLAANHLSDAVRSALSFEIVRNWAKEAPQDSSAFLEKLAKKGIRNNSAYQTVAEHWLDKDIEEGSAWIAGLKFDEVRQACIRGMVARTLPDDPERAFHWALQLPEGRQFVHMAYRAWQNHDPEAAARALEKANLSEELKNRFSVQPPPLTPEGKSQLERLRDRRPELER